MRLHEKDRLLRFCGWAAFPAVLVFALLMPSVLLPGPAEPPASAAQFNFRDFNGANNWTGGDWDRPLGIGWVRQPFFWGREIEPQKGHWDWSSTDQLLQTAMAQHIQILPDLAYTAAWAASIKGNIFSPPANAADWKDFVERVVARYSAAPYNLRYFQIWNEPTLQGPFWRGRSNMDFIDQVYLPAAKIIRKYHCYVVFGGWPDGNSLQEFNSELSHNNAWQWTDILDVHYLSPWSWKWLYDQWVKTGKCQGVWQTEVGFGTDPNALPLLYLPSLAFALSNGVRNPNEFKLFWFGLRGAGPDGPKCLITDSRDAAGYRLTRHGVRLKVLNDLLGAGPLSSYTAFTARPGLNYESLNANNSAYGFQVGQNRRVIALTLHKANFAHVPVVNVTLSLPRQPKSVSVVTVTGQRQTPKSEFAGNQLQVQVSVTPLGSHCPACGNAVGYIEVDY